MKGCCSHLQQGCRGLAMDTTTYTGGMTPTHAWVQTKSHVTLKVRAAPLCYHGITHTRVHALVAQPLLDITARAEGGSVTISARAQVRVFAATVHAGDAVGWRRCATLHRFLQAPGLRETCGHIVE